MHLKYCIYFDFAMPLNMNLKYSFMIEPSHGDHSATQRPENECCRFLHQIFAGGTNCCIACGMTFTTIERMCDQPALNNNKNIPIASAVTPEL